MILCRLGHVLALCLSEEHKLHFGGARCRRLPSILATASVRLITSFSINAWASAAKSIPPFARYERFYTLFLF